MFNRMHFTLKGVIYSSYMDVSKDVSDLVERNETIAETATYE